MFLNVILVAAGGATGAVLRYLMLTFIPYDGKFPMITLSINFIGCIVMGGIAGFAAARGIPEHARLFLQIGLCGGFTAISAMALESYNLIRDGQAGISLVYLAATLALTHLGIIIGMSLGRHIG